MAASDRIQLHPSGLTVFDECGEAWHRRYENREYEPANEYTVVGAALDAAVMADLNHKIKTGTLLSQDAVINIARLSVTEAFARGKLVGQHLENICLSRAETFAGYAHRNLCPTIEAVGTQVQWSVRLDKMLHDRGGLRGKWRRIDLVGTMDIREYSYPDDFSSTTVPDGINIRDIKTAKASPPGNAADGKHWLQLTCYALGEWVTTGRMPKRVQIDTLVSLKRGIEHRISVGERTDYDFAALFNRCVRFAQARKAGLYLPAPRGSWKCSPEWCTYYKDCAFVKNEHTIELELPPLRGYSVPVNSIAPAPAAKLLEMPRRVVRKVALDGRTESE